MAILPGEWLKRSQIQPSDRRLAVLAFNRDVIVLKGLLSDLALDAAVHARHVNRMVRFDSHAHKVPPSFDAAFSAGGGIRTHNSLTRTSVLKTDAYADSATPA